MKTVKCIEIRRFSIFINNSYFLKIPSKPWFPWATTHVVDKGKRVGGRWGWTVIAYLSITSIKVLADGNRLNSRSVTTRITG